MPVRQTIQIEGVPMTSSTPQVCVTPWTRSKAIGIARTWKAIGHADALLLIVRRTYRRYPQPIGPSSTGCRETEAGYRVQQNRSFR